MKKKTATTIPLFRQALIPAAVASALLSPNALGAAGDLDPAFGDVGRLGPILDGTAWSIEPQDDGTILLGGGAPGAEYWGWYGTTNFISRLSGAGMIDPAFSATDLPESQVLAIARQPDGHVVAVGRRMLGATNTRLVVFRLDAAGTLDSTFAGGTFELPEAGYGTRTGATSVTPDPDGRIVVAGSQDDNLIVLRLLTDGSPDESFGTAGVFEGPVNLDYSNGQSGAPTSVLRAPGGGYRVTSAAPGGCQVVAVSAEGVLDDAFGDAGIATVVVPGGPSSYCNSMVAQADGRLLVAGSAGGQGFAARLRANGQPDPGFSAGSVSATMTEATAVAAADDGAVVVAGIGVSGVSVVRLLTSGDLDASFGSGGTATFDLQTDGPVSPVIRDLYVQADDNIVGAGGVCRPDCYWSSRAFVVRLLGANGASPGVLGISQQFDIQTTEGDGEVVVNVRRTGGRSGNVSLDWETGPGGGSWFAATPGEDYTAVSGSLTWTDGDTAEQEIRVPIIANGPIDETESLYVLLTDSQGGAGLGMRSTTIVIAADGAPHGQFGFPESVVGAVESQPLRVPVFRDFYSSGVVSVTVTATSGTAIAGQDFAADPVTLSWADGESGWKDAVIQMFNDSGAEDAETFTLELSNPTGGAVIGPRASATVRIAGNDRQLSGDGSGGGAFGWLSLLLLGCLRLLRRCTVRHTASQSAGAKRVSNR